MLIAILAAVLGDPPGVVMLQDLVETERLMESLASLPTARSPHGSGAHLDGLEHTQRWIEEQLTRMGLTPERQELEWRAPAALTPDLGERAPTWCNVFADIRGTELPNELIILGSHFDAVPKSPGADDNGSGTAAGLELVRVLADSHPRRTIRVAFFNLEESGLLGSFAHAASLQPRIESGEITIAGMVSMEMLGYFSDEPGSQRSPIPARPGVFEPPTVGDFIAIAGIAQHRGFSQKLTEAMRRAEPELAVFTVDWLPVPPPDFLRSDHAPFWGIGVPAVMLTDTSNFRNPNYHRAGDTVETIDPERFTRVVRALAGATLELANAP